MVVAYWLAVITGLFEIEDDAAWLGFGGVPAGVALSLLVALAWLLCLIGAVLTSGGLLIVVPLAASAAAWLAVRALLRPLRALFPPRGDPLARRVREPAVRDPHRHRDPRLRPGRGHLRRRLVRDRAGAYDRRRPPEARRRRPHLRLRQRRRILLGHAVRK
ncbi:hypothetical protein [Nonomuraea salmonea]|uniref:hypothetical protein n=1 Tax=Nonomuraea salmonea TaxID=46181 RepID=UPI0031EA8657